MAINYGGYVFAAPERCANYGMTYRQWLVGMALIGIAASDSVNKSPSAAATWAVEAADAAIARSAKEGGNRN